MFYILHIAYHATRAILATLAVPNDLHSHKAADYQAERSKRESNPSPNPVARLPNTNCKSLGDSPGAVT